MSCACAADDPRALLETIENEAANADLVVTTGGVSVGKYDLTKDSFVHAGGKIFFDRIALRPGKPAVFAKRRRKIFFGLPGNPVSSAITFYLFVRRALMQMQSAADPAMRRGFASLHAILRGNKSRDTYFPARLASSADGKLIAVPLAWNGSSDFVAFAHAEALIVVPKTTTFNEGDIVDVLFL